ncbi:ammonium transporter [Candidatus Pelagibacter sp. RS40]|jgi:Amt family ammonium transporter|uniref:ammonium transporter n=1 Tax=Candidatus Pelagibacter sp. RS40 TaxID=1977865 RepID=UPI000A155F14|nr:ammonium transporter [Candidatus Pelagibacter sp. RS40]ARJ49348.1 ammonium transporter [Candidatus Pelagibacter sp. RS40]|tara:strand:- start:670 stop:2778 length:2109 start_codon:yes stop_codon:yes gene_type:complete
MEIEVGDVKSFIDTLWVIDCAILVFIMQAGFMCVESGLSRHKNSINVALKNAADFGVSVVVFWLFGFGLMFGKSFNGLFGTDLFMFATDISQYQTYFVFQAMFVATAATIISGAVAERLKFVGYLVMTIFATGIIYPIVGHWAWSSSYLGEAMNKGWLAALGFVDFAGSTIVHSVGGWIALSGVLILGPRIGKYSDANKGKFTGSSFPLAVLGTLILWFGWFGFNGGSNGAMDDAVPLILINTFLAAAFGLLTSLVISFAIFKKPDPFYVILGPLAGLVSITAACNSVNSLIAILIGIIGTIIAIIVHELLNKKEIDDVVGAVPVHLAAGVWGTLAVGIFSNLEILGTGLSRMDQIKAQLIGIGAIGIFSFVSSFIFFKIVNYFYPLRVSPLHEELGLNIAEHGAVSVEHDLIAILDKQSKSGDLKIRGPQDPFTAGGVIGLYYNKLMSKLEDSETEKNKWRERISKEVNLAVKVQENFLPKRNLTNFPVSGINIPAREVSGDFFSFYPHNESIYFIIADVAGKGIHAGMVMAKASTLFEIMSKDKVDPDEMMFHMNNDLYQTKTAGMFVTCILGEYDLVSEEIRWVNAGHQPALIRSSDGKYSEYISSSTPLGVVKHKDKSVYKLEKTKLGSSRFYVFTDGLSESLNKNGEEIGIDGSIKIIENNFNSDLKKQLKDVTSEVIKVAGEKNLSDDLTLVGLGN